MDKHEFVSTILMKRKLAEESESSSSSDDMWEASVERGKRQLCTRIIGYDAVIANYTNQEFKSHFRMSRATFEYLHEFVKEDLLRKIKGCPTIPSQTQLMIALWKMATTDSYRSVCDRFNIGRATAIRAVRRVTHALFKLAPKVIKWPTADHAQAVMQGFFESSGFPKIIGAIDGTHIRINAPKEDPVSYINRKGYHSIQLQLVCDQKCLITHCYTGHPGSVHDQRIFRLSDVSQFLNDDEKFPSNSHLVGDAAYQLHENLLTPFRDNGYLTRKQDNFNYRHSAARVTVERCIGLLKGRMRSLLDCLPMARIDLMAEYIVACCVVHNVCILQKDALVVALISENVHENAGNDDVFHPLRPNLATHKRNMIMDNLQ